MQSNYHSSCTLKIIISTLISTYCCVLFVCSQVSLSFFRYNLPTSYSGLLCAGFLSSLYLLCQIVELVTHKFLQIKAKISLETGPHAK
jgi:hypothetical protein